jgi:endoglucanase
MLRGVTIDTYYYAYPEELTLPMQYATQEDIQFLGDQGATVIRLALHWKYFDTPMGFELIDNYLNWCEQAGIHVILDMHVVPPDEWFGQELIWNDPAAQKNFIDLWTTIASRYANRTIIAGYDLYNEPAPSTPEQWWNLANRTMSSIRSVDAHHIFFIEKTLHDSAFQLLNDPNIVYSYHDYDPFILTHAGIDWAADSPIPDDHTYPGSVLDGVEWKDWSPDAVTFNTQSTDWVYWDSGKLKPPSGIEFATLKLSINNNVGNVWLDDFEVLKNGVSQPIFNPSIEEASRRYEGQPANWFFWSETGFTGEWSTETAHSGTHSLKLSGHSEGYAAWTQDSGRLSGPLFRVSPNDIFQVRGWLYAPENNGGVIHLGLDYLNGIYIDYNRQLLQANIQSYLDWAKANNVPLYVGEFGATRGSPGDTRYNILTDKINIMNEAGVHWTLWTYREEYFGLYAGTQLDEQLADILQAGWNSLP